MNGSLQQKSSAATKYEAYGRKLARVNFSKLTLGASGITSNSLEELFITSTNQILRISPDGSSAVYAGSLAMGFEDGSLSNAKFALPQGLHWKEPGSLYICDTNNSSIRLIEEGTVSTLAGLEGTFGFADGPFEKAYFNRPRHLVCVADCLYVADTANHRIRVLNLSTKTVSSIGNGDPSAGVGSFTKASIPRPMSISIDEASGSLLAVSENSCVLLEISLAEKVVRLLDPAPKLLESPNALFSDKSGTIYVSSSATSSISAVLPGGSLGLVCDVRTMKANAGVSSFVPTVCHSSSNGTLYCAERGRSWIWKFAQFASSSQVTSYLTAAALHYATLGILPNHPDLGVNVNIASLLLNCNANEVSTLLLRSQAPNCLVLPRSSYEALVDILNGDSGVLRQRSASFSVEEHVLRGLHVAHLLFLILDHPSTVSSLSAESSPSILLWVSAEVTRMLLSVPSPTLLSCSSTLLSSFDSGASVGLLGSVLRSRGTDVTKKSSSSDPTDESLSDSMHALSLGPGEEDDIDSAVVLKRIQVFGATTQLAGCITQMGFESLPWIPSESKKLPEKFAARSSLPKPELTITIEEDSTQIFVHEWLLYARWPYIAFMMSSGMHESVSKSLFLGDMPKGVLHAILESIYGLDHLTTLIPEHASYLLENAMQFHLENFEGDPAPAFAVLLQRCHAAILPPPVVTSGWSGGSGTLL